MFQISLDQGKYLWTVLKKKLMKQALSPKGQERGYSEKNLPFQDSFKLLNYISRSEEEHKKPNKKFNYGYKITILTIKEKFL